MPSNQLKVIPTSLTMTQIVTTQHITSKTLERSKKALETAINSTIQNTHKSHLFLPALESINNIHYISIIEVPIEDEALIIEILQKASSEEKSHYLQDHAEEKIRKFILSQQQPSTINKDSSSIEATSLLPLEIKKHLIKIEPKKALASPSTLPDIESLSKIVNIPYIKEYGEALHNIKEENIISIEKEAAFNLQQCTHLTPAALTEALTSIKIQIKRSQINQEFIIISILPITQTQPSPPYTNTLLNFSILPVILENVKQRETALLLGCLALECSKPAFEQALEIHTADSLSPTTRETIYYNYIHYRYIGLAAFISKALNNPEYTYNPYSMFASTINTAKTLEELSELQYKLLQLEERNHPATEKERLKTYSSFDYAVKHITQIDQKLGLIKLHPYIPNNDACISTQCNLHEIISSKRTSSWCENFLTKAPCQQGLSILMQYFYPKLSTISFNAHAAKAYTTTLDIAKASPLLQSIINKLARMSELIEESLAQTAFFIPTVSSSENANKILFTAIAIKKEILGSTKEEQIKAFKHITACAIFTAQHPNLTSLLDLTPSTEHEVTIKSHLTNNYNFLHAIGIALNLIGCVKHITSKNESDTPNCSRNSAYNTLPPAACIRLMSYTWSQIVATDNATGKKTYHSIWAMSNIKQSNKQRSLIPSFHAWFEESVIKNKNILPLTYNTASPMQQSKPAIPATNTLIASLDKTEQANKIMTEYFALKTTQKLYRTQGLKALKRPSQTKDDTIPDPLQKQQSQPQQQANKKLKLDTLRKAIWIHK